MIYFVSNTQGVIASLPRLFVTKALDATSNLNLYVDFHGGRILENPEDPGLEAQGRSNKEFYS